MGDITCEFIYNFIILIYFFCPNFKIIIIKSNKVNCVKVAKIVATLIIKRQIKLKLQNGLKMGNITTK